MGNSFFVYLQQLELMAFFSGYPLVYAIIVYFASGKKPATNFKARMVSVLPFAYALIGTLYLGLQLKKLCFNYSSGDIRQMMHLPFSVGSGSSHNKPAVNKTTRATPALKRTLIVK